MRLFGALLVVVLLALAVTLILHSSSTRTSLDAVSSVAGDLREPGAVGLPFDRQAAERWMESLEELAARPEEIPSHGDELRAVTATAASWAEAAPSPSLELRVAVALRAAAGELRAHAIDPSAGHLHAARRHLADARSALAGEPQRNDPTGGIRDRLSNLERAQQEQRLSLDEDSVR